MNTRPRLSRGANDISACRSSRSWPGACYLFCVPYYTYIMASRKNGTLYIGATNNIARRAYEHKTGAIPGFTKRYNVKTLVHVEVHDAIEYAIRREKTLKKFGRAKKIRLIEQANPEWRDLYEDLNR